MCTVSICTEAKWYFTRKALMSLNIETLLTFQVPTGSINLMTVLLTILVPIYLFRPTDTHT